MPKKTSEYGPGSAPYDDREATKKFNQMNRREAGHGSERIPPGTKTKLSSACAYVVPQKKK